MSPGCGLEGYLGAGGGGRFPVGSLLPVPKREASQSHVAPTTMVGCVLRT